MDRRESLKTLMVGTVAGATLSTMSCNIQEEPTIQTDSSNGYGRTPSEKEWDKNVTAQTFFNEHEMATIATLCDIILPATPTAGSATAAMVPEFVEFIVKDLPDHQLPLRGGLMWLDGRSQKDFNKLFIHCTDQEQIKMIDNIAYPDPDQKKPELGPGIQFFNRIRNLTLTGYYTTKMGLADLGYKGNVPNIWDGVPEEVLKEHDVDYDQEWVDKCVDQRKREDIAQWDDEGNLLT